MPDPRDAKRIIDPEDFTMSANDMAALGAQANETYKLTAKDGHVLGQKGETLAFAKYQFDGSKVGQLENQRATEETAWKTLRRDSADVRDYLELKEKIESAPARRDRAQAEVDRLNTKVRSTFGGGRLDDQAKQQRDLDLAELETEKANLAQAITDLAQIDNDRVALQGMEEESPDVGNFVAHQKAEQGYKDALKGANDVSSISGCLYQNAVHMQNNPGVGGDRALLARACASSVVDQLVGTNVLAEEKLGLDANGMQIGVSVQGDGAGARFEENGVTYMLEVQKVNEGYDLPQIQEGLSDLEVVDYITGQIDRHAGNIFIDPESGKVTGIDNDVAFPEIERETMIAEGEGMVKAAPGMPMQMSQRTAEHILQSDPERLRAELKGLNDSLNDGVGGLSDDEISGAVERLRNLQAELQKESPSIQVVSEFNGDTYQQKKDAQQGRHIPQSYVGTLILEQQKTEMGHEVNPAKYGTSKVPASTGPAQKDEKYEKYVAAREKMVAAFKESDRVERSLRGYLDAVKNQERDLAEKNQQIDTQTAKVDRLNKQKEDRKGISKIAAPSQSKVDAAKVELEALKAERAEIYAKLLKAERTLEKQAEAKATEGVDVYKEANPRRQPPVRSVIQEQNDSGRSQGHRRGSTGAILEAQRRDKSQSADKNQKGLRHSG